MNYFILLTQPYTKEDSISLFGKYIGIFFAGRSQKIFSVKFLTFSFVLSFFQYVL